jgi:hypothetical protein
MIMEHWCNDTDSGEQKYSEKTLSPSVRNIFHMDWPGIEPGSMVLAAGNMPSLSMFQFHKRV